MSDINKIIEDQKRELEAKLALISGNNLSALMTERKGYEAKISEIDAKIQHICKELGIEVGLEAPAKKERRTRMSGADIEAKILEALKNAPQGLSRRLIPHSASWSNPLGAPNTAKDVSGLPPTFITVAAHDPLHDDGVVFAAKLKAEGVPVALREEPTLAHSYWRSRHHSKAAMEGFRAIAAAVRHLAHEGALQPY